MIQQPILEEGIYLVLGGSSVDAKPFGDTCDINIHTVRRNQAAEELKAEFIFQMIHMIE